MTYLTILFLFTIFSSSLCAPPDAWEEHWFGHEQNLTLVFSDEDVAVYFDPDVDRNITWPFKYVGDVWRYAKSVYGDFGPENNVYAIFHTGKYSGGHPSTYFDEHHDFRNAIDCGSTSTEAWLSGQGNDLDIVTHELAHIVEIASKGVLGSPAFPVWSDSKWAEIFNYDVYLGLNMTADADRWYNLVVNGSEGFPAPNSFWFRDWFHPIYSTYGGSKVLNNFFVTLADNFSRNGTLYEGDLNLGEFVHFWSGAAGSNLQGVAANAFGWTSEWNAEFVQAQSDFPAVQYS